MRAHPTCRRVSLLASIAVGMTLLVGCAQSVGVSAADAAAHDAAPALGAPEAPRTAATSAVAATVASADAITGAEGLAPGLYGLDRLTSSTSGNTVTIRAHRPCEQVMDELQAGQWTLQSVPAEQNALGVTIGLMSYGDRLATLYLKDGDGSCTGSLTVSSPADLTVGGALTASPAGSELSLYCHVGPSPGGDDLTDLQLAYFGLFRTSSGSFVVNLSGPAKVGTNTLGGDDDGDGDQGIMVLPIKPDVAPVDAALNFIGKFFGTGDDINAAFADFAGVFNGTGTLTVTSTDPLTATLTTDTLTAYDGSDEDPGETGDDVSNDLAQYGGQTLSLTAPLHCAQ